jgi:hypothetical protein
MVKIEQTPSVERASDAASSLGGGAFHGNFVVHYRSSRSPVGLRGALADVAIRSGSLGQPKRSAANRAAKLFREVPGAADQHHRPCRRQRC